METNLFSQLQGKKKKTLEEIIFKQLEIQGSIQKPHEME